MNNKNSKICTSCGILKEFSQFSKRSRSKKDGLAYDCKKCHTKKSMTWLSNNPENRKKNRRKWYRNNPNSGKNSELKKTYGITLLEYEQMVKDQCGLCAICGEAETSVNRVTGKTKALSVDHDHKTGKVRKLLCVDCNTGLGKFKEDTSLLIKAIKYLGATI